MIAAALKRPDYQKMLRSWAIFALVASGILWISSFVPDFHDSNERFHRGYELGLVFIACSLSLMLSCIFGSGEDETTAVACSLAPSALLTLAILEFAKGGEENIFFGVVYAGMTILFLCLSLMWLKDRYSRRKDTVKAYITCTTLVVCFAGIALLAIKYVL